MFLKSEHGPCYFTQCACLLVVVCFCLSCVFFWWLYNPILDPQVLLQMEQVYVVVVLTIIGVHRFSCVFLVFFAASWLSSPPQDLGPVRAQLPPGVSVSSHALQIPGLDVALLKCSFLLVFIPLFPCPCRALAPVELTIEHFAGQPVVGHS